MGESEFLMGCTRMRIPDSTCLYVIADIHGRDDLLNKLIKAIGKDAGKHEAERCILVTLGDYIDRGWDSQKVIDTLLHLPLKKFETRHLKGNHEDLFLQFLKDPNEGVLWVENGGWATLLSYGFAPDELPETLEDLVVVRDKLLERMPASHVEFFKSLKVHYQLGDYYFVHAGVNPNVSLEQQQVEDMIWIRQEFLNSKKNFGKIIVHGHSIVKTPEVHENRIALDTGAFHTGKLTCLVLNGESRYFLQANVSSPTVHEIPID